MKPGFVRKVLSLAGATALLVAGSLCETGRAWSEDLTGKVFLVLPDFFTVRFEQLDRPAFLKAMNELAPAVEVKVLNSDNNVQRQMSQVQAAIAEGAKAIVLVAVDPKQAAGMLTLAKQAGVPVVCHGHACDDGPAYAYVAAPYVEVGQKQARRAAEVIEASYARAGRPVRLAKIYGDPKWPFYVDQVKGIAEFLDPLAAAGKLQVVCQADVLLWLPARARTAMAQCLTKTSNGVDAIFVMNDDTGGAALAAVEAAGLKGVKLFGGYDATLAGIQRVAAGLQEMDMTIDYAAVNRLAAQMAIHAMKGEAIPAQFAPRQYDNGYPGGIPEVDSINVVITQDNLQETVIESGLYTKEQICAKGTAVGSKFCLQCLDECRCCLFAASASATEESRRLQASRSRWRRTRSSAWSGTTAPASRPCSRSPAASSPPTKARFISTGRTWC
jgi:D-xylose transport system substrate-binding protein